MSGLAIFESFGPTMTVVLSVAIEGSVLLAAALLADLALRRRSAALRHRIWTTVFAALLALPVAGPVAPSWHLPIFPDGLAPSLRPEPATSAIHPLPAAPDRAETGDAVPGAGPASTPEETRTDRSRTAGVSDPGGVGVEAGWAGVRWGLLGLGLWLSGAAVLVLRLGYATFHAERLCRTAEEVRDRAWTHLLDRARKRLGVTRDVRLLRSDRVSVPMAWGVRNHAVVLPEEADRWPAERRRVVLLHEIAHVRRGDCTAHQVSALAVALHWFNPLAWIARRRQTAERELACDDAVLANGARSADYAWHLLEIARASGRAPGLAPAGVTMARKSQLEGRLLAVLDGSRDRRHVSRLVSLAVVSASLLLVLGLAGLQPWAAPQAEAAEAPSQAEVASSEERPQEPSGQDRIVRMMIDLLDDDDADVRAQAVHSLGSMEDARAVAALSQTVIDDPDADVREQAAWALGMIESERGVDGLAGALRDADPDVREQAAWGLGMIESDRGVDPLLGGLADSDAVVREQAAWALGMIESPEAVDALVAALREDGDADVRNQAAWALGMIESPEAVDALVAALREDGDADVRSQAAWALGMIEDERALEALIDAVEDGDESVGKQALWAINQMIS